MIAILDYDAGNVASVEYALQRFGADYVISADHSVLDRADGIIFPGVGHAEAAMRSLIQRGLDRWLLQTTKPVLGICVGMQLMCASSEESTLPGLGIFPLHLRRFPAESGKVPHMGWNHFTACKAHPLLIGISQADYQYYVHSYYAPPGDDTLAVCQYGQPFTAALARNQYMGVQYHPEKSGTSGATLLRNFLNIVYPPIA